MNILLPTVSGVAIAMALSGCMHTPCPVPLSCVTPEDCVCLVTGAVDERRGGDGGQRLTPSPVDDSNGGETGGKSSDGNGGHSNGGSSDRGSDDENGGHS